MKNSKAINTLMRIFIKIDIYNDGELFDKKKTYKCMV